MKLPKDGAILFAIQNTATGEWATNDFDDSPMVPDLADAWLYSSEELATLGINDELLAPAGERLVQVVFHGGARIVSA